MILVVLLKPQVSLHLFTFRKILQPKLHSPLLSNYGHTTLRGQYPEKRNNTTTQWLHETKRGQYEKFYTKKQQGNKNIDEQQVNTSLSYESR